MDTDKLTNDIYRLITLDDTPRVMAAWHASSLAHCPREQYLLRQGAVPFATPGAGKMLRWKTGHLFEEIIRPYIKSLFPAITSNVRVSNPALDLTGEYDNYDPVSKTLIEIKTVSSHAVRYRRKDETRHHLRDDKTYLHYEWQNHAYAVLMNNQPEHILYLYITLDGLLVPYYTDVQPQILNDVMNRINLLNDAWSKQEAPECLCGQEDHPFYKPVMQYCAFKTEWNCCEAPLPSLPIPTEV